MTQGACASRLVMAAAKITGRRLNVPFINLGFSESGKMEMEMTELLTELNPAVPFRGWKFRVPLFTYRSGRS
jgi:hypothetical protein